MRITESILTRVPGKQARVGFQEAPSAYKSLSKAVIALIVATVIGKRLQHIHKRYRATY